MHAGNAGNASLARTCREILDADSFVNVTYVDILGQQFVGHSVLVENIVVCASAGERGAEQEAEHSASTVINSQLVNPSVWWGIDIWVWELTRL